jgi:hypothetical protein
MTDRTPPLHRQPRRYERYWSVRPEPDDLGTDTRPLTDTCPGSKVLRPYVKDRRSESVTVDLEPDLLDEEMEPTAWMYPLYAMSARCEQASPSRVKR